MRKKTEGSTRASNSCSGGLWWKGRFPPHALAELAAKCGI
jgi:hypothetical protein